MERSENVMSMFFAQCRHGFHATVGAVVLTYLFFREMPLRSACPSTLIDSAVELIGLAVLVASWHPRCEDTDCLFGTAPLTHMRCHASCEVLSDAHASRCIVNIVHRCKVEQRRLRVAAVRA